MSLGVEREGQRLTCCWSGRSRRPGRQTNRQTWGCPTSPSQSGNLLAASALGTWGWGSSYVSCTCAARRIISGSKTDYVSKEMILLVIITEIYLLLQFIW